MGNDRFRLSDMMPNAWFYKLKDMGKRSQRRSAKKKPSFSQQTQPHCFATESSTAGSVYNRRISDAIFVETPLKPSGRGERRRTIYRPSPVSAGFSSPVSDGRDSALSPNYLFFSSADGSSLDERASLSSFCSCRISSSTDDIIIDVNDVRLGRREEKTDRSRVVSEMELPPTILTKPVKPNDDAIEVSSSTFSRKSSANAAGIRRRANPPKLPGKRVRARKGAAASIASLNTKKRSLRLSESCAIVKSSVNPQRDFRESMAEMIVENNIQATKDLEHLLACYLALNSDEFRHIIIEAFEQIWFDFKFKNVF